MYIFSRENDTQILIQFELSFQNLDFVLLK